jgi:hypothetical protein
LGCLALQRKARRAFSGGVGGFAAVRLPGGGVTPLGVEQDEGDLLCQLAPVAPVEPAAA